MADFTLPIVISTVLLGYYFKDDKPPRTKETLRMTVDGSEKPNGPNIYNSNRVNEINQEILDKSTANYKMAENPSETNILPPLFNSYSVVGKNTFAQNDIDIEKYATISQVNRLKNPYTTTQSEIQERPMFTGTTIIDQNYDLIENFGNEIDNTPKSHNNMVPFFGGTIKQNMEEFANNSLLDKYTGNRDTFKHKQEQNPLFSPTSENIYGSQPYTLQINQDRFIPSLYRQNEKPFQEERVKANIAGTTDDKIRPVFKNIDDLRVATKPQISYDGRTKTGQYGSLRGIQAPVDKNRPDTYYEQSTDQLLVTTGRDLAAKADETFYMKPTARITTSYEHYGGIAPTNFEATKQRYTKGNNEFDSMVQESRRAQLKSDTTRNLTGVSSNVDYGKNSFTAYETERESTSTQHLLNASIKNGLRTALQDSLKTTVKETTLENQNSGYISTPYNLSKTLVYFADYDPKATHKQSTMIKDYYGQVDAKNDGLGYTISNYDAKMTNEEINMSKYQDKKQLTGPQKFNISGGVNVVGDFKTRDNVLLSEQLDTRKNMNSNYHKQILDQTAIGIGNVISKTSSITNPRLDFDLIPNQLADNPYYNLR